MDLFLFAYDQEEAGYFSLEEDATEELNDMYQQLTDARDQMLGTHYTRMLLQLNLPEEGEETFQFLQTIHQEAEQYYDSDQIYLVGDSTSDYDLSSLSPGQVMISVLSDGFLCLVLLFTFQPVGCLCCSF